MAGLLNRLLLRRRLFDQAFDRSTAAKSAGDHFHRAFFVGNAKFDAVVVAEVELGEVAVRVLFSAMLVGAALKH